MGVIPTRMMPMGARRKSAPSLPYDAEVEFVESTGAQYVDTGLRMRAPLVVDVGITPFSSTVQSFFGANASSGEYFLSCGIFGWGRQSCYWGQKINVFLDTDTYYDIHGEMNSDGSKLVVNGSVKTNNRNITSNTNNKSVYLFAAVTASNNTSNTPTPSPMRITHFRATINGVLVRDFIPVRVRRVGYLFDRANPTDGPLGNGLYGSATSTPLIAGPDKT